MNTPQPSDSKSLFQSLAEKYYRRPAGWRYATMTAELLWCFIVLAFIAKATGWGLIISNGVTMGQIEITWGEFWFALVYIPVSILIYRANTKAVITAICLWTVERAWLFYITGNPMQLLWWLIFVIPASHAVIVLLKPEVPQD